MEDRSRDHFRRIPFRRIPRVSSYHPYCLITWNIFIVPLNCFCSDGEAVVKIEESPYVLTTGQVLLVMPYQTHAIETPKESQLHILVFSPEYIPDFYAKTKDFALSDPVITIDSSVAKQLYYPLFETDSLYLRKSALYQVLYLLNTKRLYYQPKIKRIS